MIQNRINASSFDRHLEDEDYHNDARCAYANHIPTAEGNGIFHVTSMMFHILQIEVIFGGQAHKDTNLHLQIFIEVCTPFDIGHISQ